MAVVLSRVGSAVVSLLLACLVASSCDSGTAPRSKRPSPSLSASRSVGPREAAEQAALAAYRDMWGAAAAASKTSNPDAPDLRRYATGDALKLLVGALYTDRGQGHVA